jgi:co-chaperonin GroES (HSP10)
MSGKVPLTPAPGYILAKPMEAEDKATSLVIKQEEKTARKAKIIAVGKPTIGEFNGKPYTTEYKPGDVILHASIGYETVKINFDEYRLLKFGNILGKYEDSNNL